MQEFLEKEIANLVQQRDNFLAMYHQATGAIHALEQMKSEPWVKKED